MSAFLPFSRLSEAQVVLQKHDQGLGLLLTEFHGPGAGGAGAQKPLAQHQTHRTLLVSSKKLHFSTNTKLLRVQNIYNCDTNVQTKVTTANTQYGQYFIEN
jgi:hypothetical protein